MVRDYCPVLFFAGKKQKNTCKYFKTKRFYAIIEMKAGKKIYFTCNN